MTYNYPLGALVAFILAGMGTMALVFGVNNLRESEKTKINIQMFLVCVCVFVWDFGYAWMSMCYDSDFAYIPRAMALLAVYMYMVFILKYVALITGYKKLHNKLIIFGILGLISWPQIITKSAVTFTATPWGYWYYSKMSAARIIQFVCVLLGLFEYYVIIAYGKKKAETKLEQHVLSKFEIFGPVLFTGYIFDTLFPSILNTPAVPGSGIAAFIAAMILFNIAQINRIYGLSKENVSQYVFDDVRVPVIITNTKDLILLYNKYTTEFLNVGDDELTGCGIHDYFDVVEGMHVEVRGHEKECILEKTDIIDKFGEKLYNIYFVRDITEERKSYRLMQKSKEDAEEANRAKSDFLANMSHEIRTPMNAIIGMSQVIIDNKEVPEHVLPQVNEIKIAGTNLLGIINDILDMSKIEAGKFELVKDEYDLAVLIHEISSIVRARLRQSEVRFVVDMDDTLPRYMVGDMGRIRQILMNVIGNAIKFTKTGSIVLRISWNKFEEAPDILFDVTDTGIGIKPEDIDKIFGKYDQVDTKKNKSIQGTGLGLAISKNLSIIMGGIITVDSVYGEGSTFHIVINQDIDKYTAIGADVVREIQEGSFIIPIKEEIVATVKSDKRVLVVDDSKVNLMVAKGLLKKYEVKVDTAVSGAESIEMVQKEKYDLVFMDQMMPEMDGVEAMHHIRDLGDEYTKLPIIALTANAIGGTREQLIAEGFNDYLAKPINVVELDRVLNTQMAD